MMTKKIKTLVATLLSGVAVMAHAFDPPTGFGNVKWGEPVAKLGTVEKLDTKPTLDCYKKQGEKLELGSAKLADIRYCFYKNKFFNVQLRAKNDEQSAAAFKEAATKVYGAPNLEVSELSRWGETTDKVQMTMVGGKGEPWTLLISYDPIWYEWNAEEEALKQTQGK